MSESWLEEFLFSVKELKKYILISAVLLNPNLVEECGLSPRIISILQDKLVRKLTETIDEFYEVEKNFEESIIEVLLYK